jgi:hypothetical protein
MMRKHTAQQMMKASLWMPKDEYNKLVELSGDLSLNLTIMRMVRKGIAEEEEKQNKEQTGVRGLQVSSQAAPITPTPTPTHFFHTTADSTTRRSRV